MSKIIASSLTNLIFRKKHKSAGICICTDLVDIKHKRVLIHGLPIKKATDRQLFYIAYQNLIRIIQSQVDQM